MFARRRQDEIRIELSPMIDMVFLLLLFLMVTTQFTQQPAVKLDLPEEGGESQSPRPEAARIAADSSGAVYLDGDVVPVDGLREALAARFADVPAEQRIAVLEGDVEADWGVMFRILDACRAAGVRTGLARSQSPAPAEAAGPAPAGMGSPR